MAKKGGRTQQDDSVDECLARYEASRRWFNDNYFSEFAEIYRSINCRVLPLKDRNGKEIKGRTNVSLPDHFVMRRKKVARLTASPPNLRIRGGSAQEVRDSATALMYRQWDLGRWQKALRGIVDSSTVFGWGVNKTWWNKVEVWKKLRRRTLSLSRTQLMQHAGAPQDKIDQAVAQQGDQLDEMEQAQAIAQFGPEVSLDVDTTKYEGPVGKSLFIGDIFPTPGFTSLNLSDWVIEHGEWNVPRLKYFTQQTAEDPDTGEERTIFDPAVVQQMIDEAPGTGVKFKKDLELRRQLRNAINQTDPRNNFDLKLRGKYYDIFEQHSLMEDGRIRIDWFGEQEYALGSMVYPWDTYGQYLYKELVLIPDILGGIGQSTIRASRFIKQLRDARANQTSDFINKKLRPKFKVLDTADVQDQHMERSDWSEVRVKDMNDINLLFDPQFPPEAWQDQAMLNREMQQVEPLINDFQPGTDTIPQSGKLATTAVLQQRSADAVTADELRQIDLYLYDQLNLNFAMTQQQMTEKVNIEKGEVDRTDALSLFQDGGVKSITVDPMEIQEDLELIPESGSTLAADDDYRKNTIMQGYQLAISNPALFNARPFGEKLAAMIPGIKIADALKPDGPPPQPPPEVRINVSVSVKWPELPGDVQAAILSAGGLPTTGIQTQNMLSLPAKINEAATHAAEVEAPHNGTDAGAAGAGEGDAGVSGLSRTGPHNIE